MARAPHPRGSPLVLVINDEEWTARSLETIFKPHGHAVLTAYTGGEGLDLAARVRPDVILVDLRLPDMDGIDVIKRIRQLPAVRASTPVVAVSSAPFGRRDRIACLRAGAWEVIGPPFDPVELLSRLKNFLAAKQDADTAREESHQDPLTGFYNVQGLVKRVTELTADATRHHRSLACIVLGSRRLESAAPGDDETATRGVANVLVSLTRLSDVVARVGEGDFVIVAPSTDSQGATRLAERILETIDADPDQFDLPPDLELRAGFHAVSAPDRDTVIPEELLSRATTALRNAQTQGNGLRIQRFETGAD